MRQGSRTEPALKETGLEGILPETPEVWSKETEYILDLTKNYHNLLQKEENGSIQSYIWDNSVLFMEEKEESYSYLNDMQGSVMRLSDHNGESTVSYGYDEFGADLLGNQGQFQPFGYTGYQRDAVAGTYYAQAREYDVRAGRFTSEDIIKGYTAYPETLNAYGYCWENPLKYVDRDGAWPDINNIKEELEDEYQTVKEWCEDNVDVTKSITATARENFGMAGKYKKMTYSDKRKNKKINIVIDNTSFVSASIKYDQKIGNIDINGNVGISGNGPQSFYSYSWVDKEEQKHNIKLKADLKSIGVEWKSGEKNTGSGIRLNLGNLSTSEAYTFDVENLGEYTRRMEEGAYINNELVYCTVHI